MSEDRLKAMRLRMAFGGLILLIADAAWFYLVSFGPR